MLSQKLSEFLRLLCLRSLDILTVRAGADAIGWEPLTVPKTTIEPRPFYCARMRIKDNNGYDFFLCADETFCCKLLESVFHLPPDPSDAEMLCGGLAEFVNIIIGASSDDLSADNGASIMNIPEGGLSRDLVNPLLSFPYSEMSLRTTMGNYLLGIAETGGAG
jgi:hypothetical protein